MLARPPHHRVFARCGVLLLVALFAYGCKSKKNAAVLATLTDAKGPVERQANAQATWDAAPTGTRFVFGDAARTADGEAKFTLARGAQLALAPRSVLRFCGAATRPFALELGSVELGGDGAYDLGFGTLDLRRNGRVRISAQGGATAVELLLGEVALLREGQTVMLQPGQPLSLELGALVLTQPDARPVETLDAAATLTLGEVQLEVTGEGTQWQPPGATAWAAVPAGRTALLAGTALRVGQGGKAVVAYAGRQTRWELSGSTTWAFQPCFKVSPPTQA